MTPQQAQQYQQQQAAEQLKRQQSQEPLRRVKCVSFPSRFFSLMSIQEARRHRALAAAED